MSDMKNVVIILDLVASLGIMIKEAVESGEDISDEAVETRISSYKESRQRIKDIIARESKFSG